MKELPPCGHRSDIGTHDWFGCSSPSLAHTGAVPRSICEMCPFAIEHPTVFEDPYETSRPHKFNSGIGTALEKIIIRETKSSVTCGACKAEIERLNSMTADQVMQSVIPIAADIVSRAVSNAQQWYQRLAAKIVPAFVANTVRGWIVEACGVALPTQAKPSVTRTVCGCVHDSTATSFKHYINAFVSGVQLGHVTPDGHRRVIDTQGHNVQLLEEVIKWNGGTERPTIETPWVPGTWEYMLTTVPERRHTTLPGTLVSLAKAGFDRPILCIDDVHSTLWDDLHLSIRFRGNRIRTAGHWYLTLLEAYIRNPYAEKYAIFQDDFVTIRNLKQYLDSQPLPENGYLNLLTFMGNEAIIADTEKGWHPSDGLGKGAVGLVFRNDAVMALTSTGYIMRRFIDSQRGHNAIDGGIVDAMKSAGWQEYIHNPSLVQHTGMVSSMGNNLHPLARSFPGKDTDAMSFIN
jgi:hypothetical protein